MPTPRCTEDEFIRVWERLGSATLVARELGLNVRNVQTRRRSIERRLGMSLPAFNSQKKGPLPVHYNLDNHPAIQKLEVEDGTVLVGSDCHYWPDIVTTAHRAFLLMCKRLKPAAVVLNGDVLDASSISRFPPIGWERRPSLIKEIEACQDRLEEIIQAAPKGAAFVWTLGNHDGRFETKLATVAPEYAKIHGVHLKDHFPRWKPAWSVWINDDVVIKHRWKNGIHAAHNNTIQSGRTMLTGHLHSLKVTPYSDYGGTRFGVDTGTMAEAYGPQFSDYTELNPVNWRSGFIVLTFRAGRLLWPEIVHVLKEGEVEFRGEIIQV